MNQMLKSALWYRQKRDFSVIPVGQDKKPPLKWEQYQTEKPSIEQIQEWWTGEYKGYNVGIVTGKISNLTVVDVDKKPGEVPGFEAINPLLPDTLITPVAQSPSGGEHLYFQFLEGTRNRTGFLPGCDLRSEGGYIVAPPSVNGRGAYIWKDGLNIASVDCSYIPTTIERVLNNYIYNREGLKGIGGVQGGKGGNPNTTQQTITNHNMLFSKGTRDDNIFHLANCLIKGGMPIEEIEQCLMFIGRRCDPPFPEDEIYMKIKSAIKRAETQEKGLTQAVRDLIAEHEGNITITNALQWLTNHNNPQDRQKIQVIMGRMVKEGLLKKTGKRAGEYRIVSHDHEIQDWKNAEIQEVDLVLPLGMHEAIKIVPGSLIIFAGVTNSGKTAFGMNFARLNCGNGTVKYLTSEIEQDEFRGRVDAYCKENRDSIERWDVELVAKFNPIALPDLINPTGLNVIDYLEAPNGDYTQITPLITDIHHMLKGGICVINIQKKAGDEYGTGGQYVKNKAHLFCTLDVHDYPVCNCKITKCKAPKYGYKNPVNLVTQYKLSVRDGLTIRPYGKFNFERWDM